MCLLAVCSAASSKAENHWFCRLGLGTQVGSGETFKGTSVSAEMGKRFGGLEVSGSMTYFHSRMGKSQDMTFNAFVYPDYSTEGVVESGLKTGRDYRSGITFAVNASYDLLHFVWKNSRHHLSPVIGLGYSVKTEVSSINETMDTNANKGISYSPDNGFDFVLGGRYEYDIAKSWSVGIFCESHFNVLENNLMGLTVKKSF